MGADRVSSSPAPIRGKDLMMSPTYFAVRNVELDARLEAARRSGDIRGMQSLLAEKTRLLRSMYG